MGAELLAAIFEGLDSDCVELVSELVDEWAEGLIGLLEPPLFALPLAPPVRLPEEEACAVPLLPEPKDCCCNLRASLRTSSCTIAFFATVTPFAMALPAAEPPLEARSEMVLGEGPRIARLRHETKSLNKGPIANEIHVV